MAWWPVERWEALRLALGARGALPREVGTLIPPPRVPRKHPGASHRSIPSRGSRGTGKPRTHCAARTRGYVRHSGALAPLRKRTRNPDVVNSAVQHLWIPGSRQEARPGMTNEVAV
jgi:hypothetical protein